MNVLCFFNLGCVYWVKIGYFDPRVHKEILVHKFKSSFYLNKKTST